MSDATPTVADEDVAEEAEAALSTVDAEFGRTTDPVRMYMREMGSVELLTREGEIEIAKRIEDGLKHMIQAISACPTTIKDILELADRIEKDEMRVDELVDGLLDPNAEEIPEEVPEETMEAELEAAEEDEDDGGAAASASLLQLKLQAMVVDQVREFLENGTISNAVNFPSVEMLRESPYRVAIANANVPNMLGQISTAMARSGLNIHNMVNKSRGEMAYTLVDVDSAIPDALIESIAAIDGVLSVRAIPAESDA